MLIYHSILLVPSFESVGPGPEMESLGPSYATLKKPFSSYDFGLLKTRGNDNEKHESGQNISEQPKQNSNTKDLPEFLKQKLKARRILKDEPAKDNIVSFDNAEKSSHAIACNHVHFNVTTMMLLIRMLLIRMIIFLALSTVTALNSSSLRHASRFWDLGEPANYKATMLDPDKVIWQGAMDEEMNSMKVMKVWIVVDLPFNAKVIRSKWLYKKKTDMDGKVHTYKVRLVAKGCTQTYRIDYEETFSLVADIRAIRILIAIVAYYDYEI
nr:retrotransposon protein, putative, Ty1-copia subclass [Tanacetum cinerariifolium]